jgi:hypothetical protein
LLRDYIRAQGYTLEEEMQFTRKLALIRKTHYDIEIAKEKEKQKEK